MSVHQLAMIAICEDKRGDDVMLSRPLSQFAPSPTTMLTPSWSFTTSITFVWSTRKRYFLKLSTSLPSNCSTMSQVTPTQLFEKTKFLSQRSLTYQHLQQPRLPVTWTNRFVVFFDLCCWLLLVCLMVLQVINAFLTQSMIDQGWQKYFLNVLSFSPKLVKVGEKTY